MRLVSNDSEGHHHTGLEQKHENTGRKSHDISHGNYLSCATSKKLREICILRKRKVADGKFWWSILVGWEPDMGIHPPERTPKVTLILDLSVVLEFCSEIASAKRKSETFFICESNVRRRGGWGVLLRASPYHLEKWTYLLLCLEKRNFACCRMPVVIVVKIAHCRRHVANFSLKQSERAHHFGVVGVFRRFVKSRIDFFPICATK